MKQNLETRRNIPKDSYGAPDFTVVRSGSQGQMKKGGLSQDVVQEVTEIAAD